MIRKNWTKKEQAKWLIHLGQCLRDGYPLALAIRLQLFQHRPSIRNDQERMIAELKKGLSLHEVLLNHRFPEDISSSIYFAEVSGELAKGLIESGETLERRERQKETLRRLLRYPILLLWIFLFMLFIIGRFLLPNFLKLYQSLSIDLPLITKILLFFTRHLAFFLFLIPCALGLASLAFLYFRSFPMDRKLKMLLIVPFVGGYTRLFATYRLSFYLGSLLRSGLSIRQSLDALSVRASAPFLRFEARHMSDKLMEGKPLDRIIAERGWYLPDLVPVIRQGELSGILGSSLYRYSGLVLAKMEEKTRTALSFCQPALLIFVGGLVLGLFASILLPIFHIINGL
ncbi:type II secretion system F family protein [Sporolactobacillus sp. THM7-7]|nr:type II secretion system F family protein [Sporolactobacillus sp. THM7-7]